MSIVDKTAQDIRDLKIQGATSIAAASVKALIQYTKNSPSLNLAQIKTQINKLINARPNEPLAQNCLSYLYSSAQKSPKPGLAATLQSAADLLFTRLVDVEEQIIKNGLGLIKPGTNVLTHCHSATVEKILLAAHDQGIHFHVYLTETRPRLQGRITASHLSKKGIPVTLMTDSAAGFTLSDLDRIKIHLVLLGADLLAADGSALNKIGSYGIALAARQAKIPLYLAATLLKFAPAVKTATQVLIEQRSSQEVWPDHPRQLSILNPAFDVVPHPLITEFVTEFGRLKPNRVKKIAKKNYKWLFNKLKVNPPAGGEKFKVESQSSSPQRTLSYFHLDQKIKSSDHIIATYQIQPSQAEVIEAVAAESSIGTWTSITNQTVEKFQELSAKIIDWQKATGWVKIAYPLALFEKGNLPQLLSSVAGNIFGMKAVSQLQLLNLEMPEKYVLSFMGPKIGLEGIRRLTGVRQGPVLGSIIKPKLGLGPQDYADLALNLFKNGFHLVKDDENLTSQKFNLFEKRVSSVNHLLRKNDFLNNKIYSFNVTAQNSIMQRRSRFVKNSGGRGVMVDLMTVGFSALQSLRQQNFGLVLHGHRAMHALLTRNSQFRLSMLVLAKLARLSGLDLLHTGTVVGKMEGGEEDVVSVNRFLTSEWYGLKKVLPVASGGLHPRLVPQLIKTLGSDLLINFGGGVHGHPQGVIAGAQAVVAAVDSVKQGISLEKASQAHPPLKIALEKWK